MNVRAWAAQTMTKPAKDANQKWSQQKSWMGSVIIHSPSFTPPFKINITLILRFFETYPF